MVKKRFHGKILPGDIVCSYKPIPWWKPWRWWELFFDSCLIIKQWATYALPHLFRLEWKKFKSAWVKCNHVRIYCGYIVLNEEALKELGPDLYITLSRLFKDDLDANNGIEIGFHWTNPVATYFRWESWMEGPQYGKVLRVVPPVAVPDPPPPQPDAIKVARECFEFYGLLYNFGLLLDIGLGIRGVFTLGQKHKVCSVGVRIILERLFGIDIIPGLWAESTLPCSFGYSDLIVGVKYRRTYSYQW